MFNNDTGGATKHVMRSNCDVIPARNTAAAGGGGVVKADESHLVSHNGEVVHSQVTDVDSYFANGLCSVGVEEDPVVLSSFLSDVQLFESLTNLTNRLHCTSTEKKIRMRNSVSVRVDSRKTVTSGSGEPDPAPSLETNFTSGTN